MIPDFYSSWHISLQLLLFVVAFIVGIVFLVKFCDIFVDSASAIARRFKIPPMIIGLTIVAMGTSCPELAVSVSDSISCLINGGNANVAIGNVVGSNIFNILVVLGVSALFTPIIIKRATLKKEYPILILTSFLLLIFGILFGIGTVTGNYAILRWEGIILVVLMIAYISYLVIDAIKHPIEVKEEKKNIKIWLAIILVVIGACGIALGGEFVVFGAKNLALSGADAIGVDHDLAESLVGLTIVAAGTSLPELVTSAIAAKKGENEIALGNVIGSNIFNILFVLGISATVNPLISGSAVIVDLIVMMTVTLILFGFSFKGKIDRKIGIIFILIYLLYLTYLILRTLNIIPGF